MVCITRRKGMDLTQKTLIGCNEKPRSKPPPAQPPAPRQPLQAPVRSTPSGDRSRRTSLPHRSSFPLVTREAKGNKDRKVTLPCALANALRQQLDLARATHARDLANGLHVQLPHRLRVKYPRWQFAVEWGFVFPQNEPCRCPDTDRLVRWHIHETNLQRAMADACRALNVTGLTPHHLRHAWATHAHRRGSSLRDLQEHLGHSHLNTTMIYITPNPTPIQSPYEALGVTL